MLNQKKWIYLTLFVAVVSFGCDKINQLMGKTSDSASAPVASEPEVKPALVAEGPMPEGVLARVGTWTLTKEEFNERLNAIKAQVPAFDPSNVEAKQLILDELINQQLLVLDAEKSGLHKQKDVVGAVDEFRRTILIQEKARLLTENVQVSEEEAKAFYEEKKALLVEPGQWHVREIAVADEQKANDLLVQILNGADFAQIAKDNSIAESAANGGDLGTIADVPFVEMANPLLALEPGKVSNVFKGPLGFYIIKLEEKTGGNQLAYEDIKENIVANQTLMKQQQVLLQYLQKLKSEYKVEVKPELLQ